jgi:tRNA dimethylallyltransferase
VRVIRALELIRLTGKKMAAIFAQNAVQRNFTTRLIVLDVPRKELYERINRRVDVMMDQGLLHEAMQLVPYKHKNALQTVGYKELFDYFDGHLDLVGAVDLIKQNSRRYAKRQITWFKRYPEAVWVRPEAFENMEVLVEQMGLEND